MDDDIYLIWSHEHTGWWRPDRMGYTKNFGQAGQYTREQAIEVCRRAVPGMREGVFNELPVKLSDLLEFFLNA